MTFPARLLLGAFSIGISVGPVHAAAPNADAANAAIVKLLGDKAALTAASDYCQEHYQSLAISASITMTGWRKRHAPYLAAPPIGYTASPNGRDVLLRHLREAAAKGDGEAACQTNIDAIADGKYDLSASERQSADLFLKSLPAAPDAAAARKLSDIAYAAAIRDKVKSNLAYVPPKDFTGQQKVSVKLTVFKDGEILATELLGKSTSPDYEAAVLRAIKKSSPLPVQDGAPSSRDIVLDFINR
jgi:hypothetical protein